MEHRKGKSELKFKGGGKEFLKTQTSLFPNNNKPLPDRLLSFFMREKYLLDKYWPGTMLIC